MQAIILGCGGSLGVPSPGLGWGNCDPCNKKNRRSRSSIAIQKDNYWILIDTSPDMREQLLENNIHDVRHVIYTHAHADHINGITELRSFVYAHKIPVNIYSDIATLKQLKRSFEYMFDMNLLLANEIDGDFEIDGLKVQTFYQIHGNNASLGVKIRDFCYSTDVSSFSEDTYKFLYNLDTWVIDCNGLDPKLTHLHLDATLDLIKFFKPKKAFLTHMDSSLDYDTLISKLPNNITPCYDGLKLHI